MLRVKGREQGQKFSVKNLVERHIEVFNLAIQSYRKSRYIYYKYIYEPLHTFKMYMKKRALKDG